MASVGIVGAGAWGTALGKVLAEHGHEVRLWSFEAEVADSINSTHLNETYLPGIELPPALKASSDLAEVASDSEYVVLATPSLHILGVTRQILTLPRIAEGRSVIGVITKGFVRSESGVGLIVESLENYLPGFYKGNLVYISGPSHAEEVAQGKLTGLISASANPRNAIRFRNILNAGPLIVFSSLDVVGVQVAAAMKNVIAIAFGVMDALTETGAADFGDNTESFLLAAGLNEIQTLAHALGASHPETFTSIAGVGDLDVTCRSKYGRNRRFGREIVVKSVLSSFSNLEDLVNRIAEIGYYPEGVFAAQRVMEILQRNRLRLPISAAVHQILNREIDPHDAFDGILHGLTRGSFRGFDGETSEP